MTKEFKFVFNALFSNENITPLTNEDNLFYFKFLLEYENENYKETEEDYKSIFNRIERIERIDKEIRLEAYYYFLDEFFNCFFQRTGYLDSLSKEFYNEVIDTYFDTYHYYHVELNKEDYLEEHIKDNYIGFFERVMKFSTFYHCISQCYVVESEGIKIYLKLQPIEFYSNEEMATVESIQFLALDCVKQNGFFIQHFPKNIYNFDNIVVEAIKKRVHVLDIYIEDDMNFMGIGKEFTKKLVDNDVSPTFLKILHNHNLMDDVDLVYALKKNSLYFKELPKQYITKKLLHSVFSKKYSLKKLGEYKNIKEIMTEVLINNFEEILYFNVNDYFTDEEIIEIMKIMKSDKVFAVLYFVWNKNNFDLVITKETVRAILKSLDDNGDYAVYAGFKKRIDNTLLNSSDEDYIRTLFLNRDNFEEMVKKLKAS